jgi:hypothetical protein
MKDGQEKKEMLPVDLGHLEDKALAIVDAFRKAGNQDRSAEYRKFWLDSAEQIANVMLRDFGYYFDCYKIGGIIPYGLDKEQL